jgi:hypothetical protein
MNPKENEPEATAISVGDGSLGGAAVGGSVTGPDAGVIRDPVGDDLAVPVTTDPTEAPPEGEPASDDRAVRDAAMERTDPNPG